MANQIAWAQGVCLRYADNTNDSAAQGDLDDVQAHWDSVFGPMLAQALSDANITDNATNRALVQMIAVMSPGTPSRALKHACAFFKSIDPL